ncbi:Uncharacterized protein GNX_1640 [Leptospira interrogans serovar Canicola]|nr:Uncharacterized protein GNX_1640 [Leptospira interrogans serovar Canicola]
MRQSLLSKGISEEDVSFLLEISEAKSGFAEIAFQLNRKDKRTLLHIANFILKNKMEENL